MAPALLRIATSLAADCNEGFLQPQQQERYMILSGQYLGNQVVVYARDSSGTDIFQSRSENCCECEALKGMDPCKESLWLLLFEVCFPRFVARLWTLESVNGSLIRVLNLRMKPLPVATTSQEWR
jgi:hypothetical protein